MLQRGDGSGVALSADLRHILHLAKIEAVGRAGGHAGGIQSLVDAIHTIIAFDDLSGFRIPLGCAPGACGDASLAAHTEVLIDKNDAVAAALLHGASRAGGHTPGVLTMEAGHKNVGGSRQAADHFRADLNDLTQPGTDRQIFVCFALHLTRMASDALFGVLKQIVFAHGFFIISLEVE